MDWNEILKIGIGAVSVILGSLTNSLGKIIEAKANNMIKIGDAKTDNEIEKLKKEVQKKENEKNEILNTVEELENKNISGDINTVIVASGGTIDWNIENKAYFHPKTRSFRDKIKYLGFYYRGKVMGYGEIEKIEDDKKLKELVKTANEKGYEVSMKNHDFFSCEKDFKETDIDWNKLKRSPVMSKQYISLDELLGKNK